MEGIFMSKGSGMGRKRAGSRPEKGIGKCGTSSNSKQCGNGKYVSKGSKQQDLQLSQEALHQKSSSKGVGGLEFDEEE